MSGQGAPLWRERPGARSVDVCGIGQNALDHVGLVDRHPAPGDKLALRECADRPGGQVATAVLACARLGLRGRYVGAVGDDAAGSAALAPLRDAGVDLDSVRVVPGASTQTALIWVDAATGERTILWHRPAALRLAPAHLDRAAVETARALLLDAGDPEAAAWAAGIARSAGIPVVLDADRYAAELDPLLSRVDFPLVSRGFAESFSGRTSVRETLRELVRRGARLAAVTRGEAGVAALCGDRFYEEPALAVDAVDTTGAGDAFHGGFAWALLEGGDAPAALRAASAVAGLSCRAAGAQGGLPDRAAVAAALAASRRRD